MGRFWLAGPGAGAWTAAGERGVARGFVGHAVSAGQAPAELLALIYELADERDLPERTPFGFMRSCDFL